MSYELEGFGYSVVVENAATNTTINLVQSSWTSALFFEALAGGVALVAVFTGARPKHNLVIGAAIALAVATGIVEFVLFKSVEKVAPILGSQVKTSLGPGSLIPFPSSPPPQSILPPPPAFLYYLGLTL